eukprot:6188278-Pleurochrysis_carterae.AAC.1
MIFLGRLASLATRWPVDSRSSEAGAPSLSRSPCNTSTHARVVARARTRADARSRACLFAFTASFGSLSTSAICRAGRASAVLCSEIS